MMRRPWLSSSLAALTVLVGCASAPKVYPHRVVETPVTEHVVPGPVRSTSYLVNVSMEHNIAHIFVLERSECPAIRVRVVHRLEEVLDGHTVVEVQDHGSREYAETQSSLIQCEARFSRAGLALQYDGHTYPLGYGDDHGQLHVDLASVMKINTRAIDLTAKKGLLLVNGAPATEISMDGLLKQQQRLDAIIETLRKLLGKDAARLTDADVTNASMLYQEMRELAPDDARTIALQQRFVEVIGGFRDVQRTASLKRNLGALSESKELLAALKSSSAVPTYMHVSIATDGPTPDAIAWARAQALLAMRDRAALCAGGFDWARVAQLPAATRVAFSYLRYAFDDLSWLNDACLR